MSLINCPECSTEVSDKAASCPRCGFPLTKLSSASQNSTSSISQQTNADEGEFKDAGLQIVGTCERALSSPRMFVDSIISEAESQLDRLKAKYQSYLSSKKYDRVYTHLFCCISSVRIVMTQDGIAGKWADFGGAVGGLLGFSANLQKDKDIRRVNAYTSDLRIMLGAAHGTPDAVDRLPADDRDSDTDSLGTQSQKDQPNKNQGCLVMILTLIGGGSLLVIIGLAVNQ